MFRRELEGEENKKYVGRDDQNSEFKFTECGIYPVGSALVIRFLSRSVT